MKISNAKKWLWVALASLVMSLGSTAAYGYVNEKESTKQTESVTVPTTAQATDEKIQVRYPNKLTPKKAEQASTGAGSGLFDPENAAGNKGIASTPSVARATVIESKDNANAEYPVHNGETEDTASDIYSADARQFITFQTRNGKTFHLIINHDEKNENVLLLTEVSEDDLLNLTNAKESKKEVTKAAPIVPVTPQNPPVKKAEKNDSLLYVMMFVAVGGALLAGYYFKVRKKKEDSELKKLEEEEDYIDEEKSEEPHDGYGKESADEEDDILV